jgi:Flp pilus assembly secretin CpaC
MKRLATAVTLALAALSAEAVVVRRLPPETVVESETISLDSMGATSVRSSNTSVFAAALRESGEAVVSGTRLGDARLDYVDERGIFATRSVTVVPQFWSVLKKMFSEDPEITIDIVGDKVVIGGSTANVDTLRRVDAAKSLDQARIVAQVTYSTAQIAELVRDFLNRAGATNISVNVVGREVCLSGKMYDRQSIEQLGKRVEGFVKDFPGLTVNTDELRIIKQKIVISIEFLAYSDMMARNLGFDGPESITASLDWNFGYTHDKSTGGSHNFTRSSTGDMKYDSAAQASDRITETSTRTGTWSKENKSDWSHKWNGGANVGVTGVKAAINLLKSNGAAKQLYSTSLSTQSGMEAEFQNGGTIHKTTSDLYKNDLKEIDYGYIIKTTPLIVDANTVNLDFDLDLKQLKENTYGGDLDVSRYQTKSKYLVRPGETIVLSGYKYRSESQSKKGMPWLSNIPWLGEKIFGSTKDDMTMNEMLLVVTVDWALEDDSENARERLDEMKNRTVETEMP